MAFKKMLAFVLLVSCLVLAAGCVNKTDVGTPAAMVIHDVRTYFPCEPGMTWVYEGIGNEYAGFTSKVMYQEGSLGQVSKNNGGTELGLVYRITPQAVILFFTKAEFYTDTKFFHEMPNCQEVVLEAPLIAGHSWQDDRDRREVKSVEETVQVPLGQFEHVVKIKVTPLASNNSDYSFEYYAPNVGLILQEYISGDYKIVSQLKAFKKTAN